MAIRRIHGARRPVNGLARDAPATFSKAAAAKRKSWCRENGQFHCSFDAMEVVYRVLITRSRCC